MQLAIYASTLHTALQIGDTLTMTGTFGLMAMLADRWSGIDAARSYGPAANSTGNSLPKPNIPVTTAVPVKHGDLAVSLANPWSFVTGPHAPYAIPAGWTAAGETASVNMDQAIGFAYTFAGPAGPVTYDPTADPTYHGSGIYQYFDDVIIAFPSSGNKLAMLL